MEGSNEGRNSNDPEKKTWELVDKPKDRKIVGLKWVFKTKHNPDNSINKYKASLVVTGYEQILGIDYSEAFAPVARLETIRLLLAISAQKLGVSKNSPNRTKTGRSKPSKPKLTIY